MGVIKEADKKGYNDNRTNFDGSSDKGREVIYAHDLSELKTEGQYYIKDGVISTILTSNAVFKNAEGFDNDLDLAYEALDIWKTKGFKGNPSSPASFFRTIPELPKLNVKASHNWILQSRFHGGWIERIYPEGVRRVPVYQYDIKKAYYWAGSLGLPTTVKNYKAGDKNFICIFENEVLPENVPNTFERRYVIATNEDIDTYNLKGKILKAYTLENFDFYPNEHIEKHLSDLPKRIFKRLTQSYWGMYANGSMLERAIMKNKNGTIKPEKIIMMPNRFQNYIYSSIIINRVIRRLYGFVKRTVPISVFVDSVLCETPLETGNEIGDMVLKDYYNNGILIKSSGLWSPMDKLPDDTFDYAHYYKHAGYQQ